MARRPTTPNVVDAILSFEQINTGITRLEKRIESVRKFDPLSVQDQFNIPEIDRLSADIDDALVRTFGSNSHDYNRYRGASHFDNGPFNALYHVPIFEVQNSLARSKAQNLALLEQAVESLKERRDEMGPVGVTPINSALNLDSNRKVFIVHGHDDAARETVARFLNAADFHPIILHEQANQGRTVIEKVEAHGDVGFAVIILTPDDIGGAKGDEQRARARQNVILELGYFVGRLGRNRVCALKKGDIEIPSDFGGVVYEPFDASNGWKLSLGRELKAAGYEFSFDKALG